LCVFASGHDAGEDICLVLGAHIHDVDRGRDGVERIELIGGVNRSKKDVAPSVHGGGIGHRRTI